MLDFSFTYRYCKKSNETDTYNISQEEVIRRLRVRGQPIRLFAETDKSRKARLRTLELMEERSEGQRNDFMRTLEQMDEGMNLEALKRKAAGGDQTAKPVKKARDDALIEPVNMEWLQKQPEKLYPIIYGYFKVSFARCRKSCEFHQYSK
jgi:pre-mRNA-splicing factor 18